MNATEPPPLTPAAIQGAEIGLAAYLQARAADFEAHGWKDGDGLIETRGASSLLAPHIDTTLRRARAAERDRDQVGAENAALRSLLARTRAVADEWRRFAIEEDDWSKDPAWAAMAHSHCCVLSAIDATAAHPPRDGAQPDADGPAAAPLPPQWANSSSTPQGPAADAAPPENLPGHLGKPAAPPAWLKPEPAYRHQPSPGHIVAYKLDHCGPCRDAEFYGWTGHTADQAHARHLETIDVGPLAGQPCRCKRCAVAAGRGLPDA